MLGKIFLVRLKGLEPPRLSAPDPKSGAATNYATAAFNVRAKNFSPLQKYFRAYQVFSNHHWCCEQPLRSFQTRLFPLRSNSN